MPISQCDQESIHYCHIVAQTSDLLLDYRYAQEEDSKWEKMICLTRVNFETNFKKMNISVSP